MQIGTSDTPPAGKLFLLPPALKKVSPPALPHSPAQPGSSPSVSGCKGGDAFPHALRCMSAHTATHTLRGRREPNKVVGVDDQKPLLKTLPRQASDRGKRVCLECCTSSVPLHTRLDRYVYFVEATVSRPLDTVPTRRTFSPRSRRSASISRSCFRVEG